MEEETAEHVLFLCNHARAVWSGSNMGFLTYSYGNLDIVEWWKNLENLNKVKDRREGPDLATMSLNTWCVSWNARNNLIFNNIAICTNKSIRLIQKNCLSLCSLDSNNNVNIRTTLMQRSSHLASKDMLIIFLEMLLLIPRMVNQLTVML